MPPLDGSDGAVVEAAQLLHLDEQEQLHQNISPREVTKVALRLKHQVEAVIPVELEEERVTKALSPIITPKVVQTAREAGGKEYGDCVVFCLVVCKGWFKRQAKLELWDADLHDVRAVACEVLAKKIIESEEDQNRLLQRILLQRFSIVIGSNGELSDPANVIERSVDLHALRIIGSSGYQKAISYLWRGWLVQNDDNPHHFIFYNDRINGSYWAHLDPDRMRVPKYQNALQIIFHLAYLGLYTGAINTINPTGDLDPVEGLLYLFTLGFIIDEALKIWKVGRWAVGFWTVFNSTLYALVTVSFITRMIALGHTNPSTDHHTRKYYNHMSYNFLAFTAPMFWMRLMLYFDVFKFFGDMLIVTKMMMKESLIFFALLFFILVGFFQGFIGLDLVDESVDKTSFIMTSMANAIMSSPDFSGFDNFAPPFGIILFYLFSFIIMVILLNILIALYNSSYEDVSSNATDEYMALFAQKTLNFIRAPDEHVFIAPFNLIEIVLLVLPFEWWVSKQTYERLNSYVMAVIYAPLLTVTAFIEQRDARTIVWNRRRGEEDDDTIEEWEVLEWKPDAGADGVNGLNAPDADTPGDEAWVEKVKKTSPDPAKDLVMEEIKSVQEEIEELKKMVAAMAEGKTEDVKKGVSAD